MGLQFSLDSSPYCLNVELDLSLRKANMKNILYTPLYTMDIDSSEETIQNINLRYITNNTKVFKCNEYKIVKKCKSYIILNDNYKVIKYENKHTCPGKEYDASAIVTPSFKKEKEKMNEEEEIES
ncbi:hypothetical protein H8356DRAFT_1322365 [Neocallimastix lanati (nom. inval.)]|nr:hypothetical protein H8356DRAFT_1322365 [Neocallimastix sp. JGI-2020a]